MKQPAPPAPVGYLASLRSLGDGLLATVQERVELFALELREEKFRVVETLIWVGAVFGVGMLAIIFGSLTLVFLFWDTARIAVLGGLAAFYFIALVGLILGLRRCLARQPTPLAATRQELVEDRACTRNGN
jgi:uncharacterized membrane protein YqjE